MLIIDLSYCAANGDGRTFHGGGHYGYSAARYIVSKSKEEIAVLVQPGFDIRTVGLDVNQVTVMEKKSERLPYEYDRYENILFLPLPYLYIENFALPKKARVWATVHGLRNLELARLLSQSITINLNEDRRGIKGIVDVLRSIKRYRMRSVSYENELKKISQYRDFILNGNRILTVSEHSKWTLELLEVVGEKDNSIHVAYPLHPFEDKSLELAGERTGARKGVLSLSVERREKNFTKLLEAIEKSQVLRRNVKKEGLMITGRPEAVSALTSNIKDIEITNLGYCSDNELIAVFQRASVLVYTSINEGFGIPPVQAFRAGTPVLASPVTSIAEICGDAAIYANPFDYGEIANRLLMLLSCSKMRLSQAEKGYTRYEELRRKAYNDWDYFLKSEGVIR